MPVRYFFKIQGVEGESQDARHRDEIEVESWSWGETNQGSGAGGGGGGAGKVTMANLRFVARLGRASPKLLLACAAGQHIPSAVLAAQRTPRGQGDFLTITLSDVLVTEYEVSDAGSAEEAPGDRIGLGFGRLVMEYRPENADGSLGEPVRAGWDLKENRPA